LAEGTLIEDSISLSSSVIPIVKQDVRDKSFRKSQDSSSSEIISQGNLGPFVKEWRPSYLRLIDPAGKQMRLTWQSRDIHNYSVPHLATTYYIYDDEDFARVKIEGDCVEVPQGMPRFPYRIEREMDEGYDYSFGYKFVLHPKES